MLLLMVTSLEFCLDVWFKKTKMWHMIFCLTYHAKMWHDTLSHFHTVHESGGLPSLL